VHNIYTINSYIHDTFPIFFTFSTGHQARDLVNDEATTLAIGTDGEKRICDACILAAGLPSLLEAMFYTKSLNMAILNMAILKGLVRLMEMPLGRNKTGTDARICADTENFFCSFPCICSCT
jgi:hypothetical protein